MSDLSLQGDNEQLLKRLIISHADLNFAGSAIGFLAEGLKTYDAESALAFAERRKLKCFESAFIVSYSRPFFKNEGGKYKKLELKQIGVTLTEKETYLHNGIVTIRKKIYAHSDEAYSHVRLDYVPIYDSETDDRLPLIQQDETLLLSTDDNFAEIRSLIQKLLRGIHLTVQQLGKTVENKTIYLQRARIISPIS